MIKRIGQDGLAAVVGLVCLVAIIYLLAITVRWRPGPDLDEAPIARRHQ